MARFTVRIQPGASRAGVVGRVGEHWKLAVAAPPVDGRANQACMDLLSKVLGARKASLGLVRGSSSRLKTFEADGLSADEIDRALAEAAKR